MTDPNGNVHPATVPKRAAVPFVAVGRAIMRGSEHVAQAVSNNFAKRVAAALNFYRPNSRGQ